MIEKIKVWLMANKTIAYIIAGVVAVFLFKKFFKSPVRRRRNRVRVVNRPVRRRTVVRYSPARRTKTRTTGGKKPWQIKGSLAARRRMAQIRRRK